MDMPIPSTPPLDAQPPYTRRRFVRLGWIMAGCLLVGGQLWLLFQLFFTPTPPGEGRGQFALGALEDVALGEARHFRKARCIVARHPTGMLALSDECTHQKCTVEYRPAQRLIVCPCHGSQFATTGAVLTGPASRPLDRFAVTEHGGDIIVDTTQRLSAPAPG